MKFNVIDRTPAVSLNTALAVALSIFFAGCGGGIVAPLSPQGSGPAVAAVIPDSGPPAGGTLVIIKGSNLAATTQSPPSVSFGGVPATQVSVVSSTQIKAVIPPHSAGTVGVEVTTSSGLSSTLGSGFTYTQSSPTVSGVSPNSGPTAGGTTVTIAGTNFANGAKVSFGGSAASAVSFVSSTQLKATTPAHTAGAVTVQVTNPDGTSAALPSSFTYGSTTLSVKSVSPISGPADGGTTVTITGSDFQSGVSVTFGGLGATSVTASNSTTIQATTPTHASGSVTVTVTNPDGQSATLTSGFAFHSVSLAWSAPSSSPVPVTGYNVLRALSSSGPFGKLNGSTPISSTSFTDGTVQGGTTYYYEVTSVDSSGTESAPEGPVAVTVSP